MLSHVKPSTNSLSALQPRLSAAVTIDQCDSVSHPEVITNRTKERLLNRPTKKLRTIDNPFSAISCILASAMVANYYALSHLNTTLVPASKQ